MVKGRKWEKQRKEEEIVLWWREVKLKEFIELQTEWRSFVCIRDVCKWHPIWRVHCEIEGDSIFWDVYQYLSMKKSIWQIRQPLILYYRCVLNRNSEFTLTFLQIGISFFREFWTEYPEFSINLLNFWEYFRTRGGFAIPICRKVRVSKVAQKAENVGITSKNNGFLTTLEAFQDYRIVKTQTRMTLFRLRYEPLEFIRI
jgi:hypothetical protein